MTIETPANLKGAKAKGIRDDSKDWPRFVVLLMEEILRQLGCIKLCK